MSYSPATAGIGFTLLARSCFKQFGDQERHVDRLLGIETGIAHRVIAVVEILVGDGARAADAFGDVLPGHLQMHAAGMGAFGLRGWRRTTSLPTAPGRTAGSCSLRSR